MTTTKLNVVHPLPIADARRAVRHVFIRDLVLKCSIGVHGHERQTDQRVRINLDLAVQEADLGLDDDLRNVVCYEDVANTVRAIVARGHVNLVETLAEDIAAACLRDKYIRSLRVRVEKLDVFADAASVGVEIERVNKTV
ncbi:MAG: dihydroneopterin aldolase [Rhodospirillales bacterium]|jgi:dihydroneopterin aldolase|nr:dihydroneopterin aldolase [Rhodospirillales bacterium]MDP6885147.1 dihydroneopterin aldolase [Rhodospirillales bacterium]